jgi:hypothetical protein
LSYSIQDFITLFLAIALALLFFNFGALDFMARDLFGLLVDVSILDIAGLVVSLADRWSLAFFVDLGAILKRKT